MSDARLLITPQTKVGELLKAFPELEDVLISVAPAFKKLRNPVLLRTVAKVTSLAQAARVGGVSVTALVQQLRRAVGQPEFTETTQTAHDERQATAPAWFDPEKINHSLDARAMIDAGEQPIGRVLSDLERLSPGRIYELVTPFEPAPLIDRARAKGFVVFTRETDRGEFRTYFKQG